MRFFLSSVVRGLEAHRDAAARAIQSLGHQVHRSEDLSASPDAPRRACLAEVRNADALILLMGPRYGQPQSSGLSATHEEYREARERCPVFVFVQDDIEAEPPQREFLAEIQHWDSGHLTKRFASAEQLRDAVTRSVHDWELGLAKGGVDADALLVKARQFVPDHHKHGETTFGLVIAGGPTQPLVRPAALEETTLQRDVQREAIYGESAVLDSNAGVTPRLENAALVLEQHNRSVLFTEDGSLQILLPARPDPRTEDRYLPVLVEEEIRERLQKSILFGNWLLDRLDPDYRISDLVPVAALLGVAHMAWRTRAEHDANPGSVSLGMGREDTIVVHLTPPALRRATLPQRAEEVADDLLALLRRQMRA